jgi:hypothetical protein
MLRIEEFESNPGAAGLIGDPARGRLSALWGYLVRQILQFAQHLAGRSVSISRMAESRRYLPWPFQAVKVVALRV